MSASPSKKRRRRMALQRLSAIADNPKATGSERKFAAQMYSRRLHHGTHLSPRQKLWYDKIIMRLEFGQEYTLPPKWVSAAARQRKQNPPSRVRFRPDWRPEMETAAKAAPIPSPPPPAQKADPREPCQECGFIATRCQCDE